MFSLRLYLLCAVLALLMLGSAGCSEQVDTNDNKQEEPVAPDTMPEQTSRFIQYSDEAVVGQAVYVPVYSHIYQNDHQKIFNLTATLSIRNTSTDYTISLLKVYYYDSNGNLVHKYLDRDSPVELNPLSSTSYVIEEEDLRGGVGANFLVLWESGELVTNPVVESVMISTTQQQGISFVSEGKIIHELK